MSTKRLIYALKCPFTKEVHYVGKSTKGMLRPLEHCKESHSEKVQEWVTELKKIGYVPEIDILQYVSETENIDDIENFYIKNFVSKNNLLLNSNLVKAVTVLPNLEESDPTGMKTIGEFVKRRRKMIGLTQEKLANYSGIGLRFVRELEGNKKNNFNTETLNNLLAMFGCRLTVEKIKTEV